MKWDSDKEMYWGTGKCLQRSTWAVVIPSLAEVSLPANYVLWQRCVRMCACAHTWGMKRKEPMEISCIALYLTRTQDIPLPVLWCYFKPHYGKSLLFNLVFPLNYLLFIFDHFSWKCCKLPAWISLAWKRVIPRKHILHQSALPKDCRYIYNMQSWKISDRRGNEDTDMSVCNWIFIILSPSFCICH